MVVLRGYCRVSTQDQAASNRTSLGEQERVLRGFAMMKGIPDAEIKIYSDPGVSAATPLDQRPSGKKIMADARKGDFLVASKLDRMFRSAIDALQVAQTMKEQGINLVLLDMGDQPVTSNGMAECFFCMAAAFAQLERTRIAERMTDGRKAKKAKHGHLGGHAPYGYKVVGSGRDAKLVPVEAEQEAIKKVRALYHHHREWWPTYLAFKQFDFKNRNGKPFHHVQVQRICESLGAH